MPVIALLSLTRAFLEYIKTFGHFRNIIKHPGIFGIFTKHPGHFWTFPFRDTIQLYLISQKTNKPISRLCLLNYCLFSIDNDVFSHHLKHYFNLTFTEFERLGFTFVLLFPLFCHTSDLMFSGFYLLCLDISEISPFLSLAFIGNSKI